MFILQHITESYFVFTFSRCEEHPSHVRLLKNGLFKLPAGSRFAFMMTVHVKRVCWLLFAPVTWCKASHPDKRFGGDDGDDEDDGADSRGLQCWDEEERSHSGLKLTLSCRAREQRRDWNNGTIQLEKHTKKGQKMSKNIF